MKVVIIANGEIQQHGQLKPLLSRSDLLVAADGGANHCARLGITPDILLGDLDSIDPDILARFSTADIEIFRHPVRKDATDLELAMDLAKERGASEMHLFGVLGGRWDMSLGNIFLAASVKYQTVELSLIGPDCCMHIFHPGKVHRLTDGAGRRVSLLPINGDAHGVSLSGFSFALKNKTITAGSSLGTS
ncbi:MAG: thiamine diphosphokinase, partial [Desulforhopalus sp.]